MRLNGSFNPDSSANSASIFGSANNPQAAYLRLKNGSFEDFVVDAKFKPVEGVVVSDADQKQNRSRLDEAHRHSVHARINENQRRIRDRQDTEQKEVNQKSNRTEPRNREARPSYDFDKAVNDKKVFQANLDAGLNPDQDLRQEVSKLRRELADVKALAQSNRDAINAFTPMQRPRFRNTYDNPGTSTNSSDSSSASTLSQADIHYLRYGGEQKTLDIWA